MRTGILVPYGIITVVSAYVWRYAFQLDSGFVNQWFGLGDYNWFGSRWSSLFVIILSEIWKTTPFISLLLLAGLVQVPMELQEAAEVDGATAWQRIYKVTLPNMKAAIMVALLFRTLDAWRIFDNPFVMTNGANNTETLSFLAYRQNVTLVNLGAGSAVSVLLFMTVVVIAFIFIKGFKTDLSQVRGDRVMATNRKTSIWWTVWGVLILLWALFPLVWMVSLSFKDPDTFRSANAEVLARGLVVAELQLGVQRLAVHLGAAQLVRDRDHRHAVVGDRRHVRRLRDRPPRVPVQEGAVVDGAGDRHVPAGGTRRPAVRHVAKARHLRHVDRLDHPVPDVRACRSRSGRCRRSSARSRGRWSRRPRSTGRRRGRRSAR